MSLVDLLNGPLCRRWAMTLLQFVWQGFVIAGVLAILLKCCGARRASTRYACWLAGLVAMAASPVVTFILLDRQPSTPRLAARVTAVESPEAVTLAVRSRIDRQPLVIWNTIVSRSAASSRWIVLAWMGGVLVLSARLLVSLNESWRLQRLRRPLPAEWAARVGRLGQRLGVRIANRVFVSHHIAEALATGFLRPIVLLPASWLTDLPPDMVEAVIAHELAHIRRWDLWINLFQRVVETLLFFHPAVWWLSRRLRSEREMCCDELAVVTTGKRVAYASTLEFLARGRVAARPVVVTGVGDEKMKLLARVRNVLGLAPLSESAAWWPAGVASLAVLLALGLANFRGAALADDDGAAERAEGQPGSAESRQDAQPGGASERKAAPAEERGRGAAAERKAERSGPADMRQFNFPAELALTEEQQTKLKELQDEQRTKLAALAEKMKAIPTAEQKAAGAAAETKIREGGLARTPQAAEIIAAAMKLTDEQKSQLDAVKKEMEQLQREAMEKGMALLTPEQKAKLPQRAAAGGAREAGLPAEIALSDEQKAKLKAIDAEFLPKIQDLEKKQLAVLTEEQQAARAAAETKIREGGSARRSEAAEIIATALKLTAEQKSQLETLRGEVQQLREQAEQQKRAILTSEQKEKLYRRQAKRTKQNRLGEGDRPILFRRLHKIGPGPGGFVSPSNSGAHEFAFPAELALSDEQKEKLKAIKAELGPKIAELSARQDSILTDQQKAARLAAQKAASEAGKDRREAKEAIAAAINLTDEQKGQLAAVEQEIQSLQQQKHEKMLAVLTNEQKEQLHARRSATREELRSFDFAGCRTDREHAAKSRFNMRGFDAWRSARSGTTQ